MIFVALFLEKFVKSREKVHSCLMSLSETMLVSNNKKWVNRKRVYPTFKKELIKKLFSLMKIRQSTQLEIFPVTLGWFMYIILSFDQMPSSPECFGLLKMKVSVLPI